MFEKIVSKDQSNKRTAQRPLFASTLLLAMTCTAFSAYAMDGAAGPAAAPRKQANLFICYQHKSYYLQDGKPDPLKLDNGACANLLRNAVGGPDMAILVNGVIAYPLLLYSARTHCAGYASIETIVAQDTAKDDGFARFANLYAMPNVSILTQYNVYMVMRPDGRPTDERFILFIPKNKTIDTATAFNTRVLKKIEFTPTADRATQQAQIDAMLELVRTHSQDCGNYDTTIPAITSIFAPNGTYAWNIVLVGHGNNTKATAKSLLAQIDEDLPIRVCLATKDKDTIGVAMAPDHTTSNRKSVIANLPVRKIGQLLSFFHTISVNIVVVISCFGNNAELIERELALIDSARRGTEPKRSFIVTCQTPFDTTARGLGGDQLRRITSLLYTNPARDSKLKHQIAEILAHENKPVFILMPNTPRFEAIWPGERTHNPDFDSDSDSDLEVGDDSDGPPSLRSMEALLDIDESHFLKKLIEEPEPASKHALNGSTASESSDDEDERAYEKKYMVELVKRTAPKLSDAGLLAVCFRYREFSKEFLSKNPALLPRLLRASPADLAYAYCRAMPTNDAAQTPELRELIEKAKKTLITDQGVFTRIVEQLKEQHLAQTLNTVLTMYPQELGAHADGATITSICEWACSARYIDEAHALFNALGKLYNESLAPAQKTEIISARATCFTRFAGLIALTEENSQVRNEIMCNAFRQVLSKNHQEVRRLLKAMEDKHLQIDKTLLLKLFQEAPITEDFLSACYQQKLIDTATVCDVIKELKPYYTNEDKILLLAHALHKTTAREDLTAAIQEHDIVHVRILTALHYAHNEALLQAIRNHVEDIATQLFADNEENHLYLLKTALRNHDWDAAQWFVDHAVDARHDNRDQLLFEALEDKDWPRAHWLIEHGADWRAQFKMFLGCDSFNDVRQWLIEQGPNWPTGYDEDLLETALYRSLWPAVQTMIDRGANVHFQQDLPLRQAIKEHNWDMATWLIEHGADVHIDHEMAVNEARNMHNDEFVNYLVARGGWRTKLAPILRWFQVV